MDRAAAGTEKVWDPFVRVFHWGVVALVAAAFSTQDWKSLHIPLGYAMLALLGARLVWGFVGTRHARFSDFVARPRTVCTRTLAPACCRCRRNRCTATSIAFGPVGVSNPYRPPSSTSRAITRPCRRSSISKSAVSRAGSGSAAPATSTLRVGVSNTRLPASSRTPSAAFGRPRNLLYRTIQTVSYRS